MKTKIFILSLLGLLLVSVFLNIRPDKDELWFVSFPDANTRPTYDTFHHIKEAQHHATGRGIKVGIIGKYFGYTENKDLYAGGKDFIENPAKFETIGEHGLWMATILKEIAPDVEIYALNARDRDHDKEREAIVNAINWAIANDLDVLTYSAEAFRSEDREVIDKAVRKAIENNIVTTFIHYDLQENILPTGFFPGSPESYSREADLNVYHFDYNLLLLFKYRDFVNSGRKVTNNIGALPYFSNSSMSPVLAGIVAMMKELNNNLSVSDYKKILIETSREIEYNGYKVNRVVDAKRAVDYVLNINEKE